MTHRPLPADFSVEVATGEGPTRRFRPPGPPNLHYYLSKDDAAGGRRYIGRHRFPGPVVEVSASVG